MRRYFCDSCGEEKKDLNIFEVPCHLYSMKSKCGYSDMDGNTVSGRKDVIELCNRCLNAAYIGALTAIEMNDKG